MNQEEPFLIWVPQLCGDLEYHLKGGEGEGGLSNQVSNNLKKNKKQTQNIKNYTHRMRNLKEVCPGLILLAMNEDRHKFHESLLQRAGFEAKQAANPMNSHTLRWTH